MTTFTQINYIKIKKMDKIEKIESKKDIIKSIKSLYILTEVFSFLSEKEKLSLISYNKEMQKFLEIDIEDYKRISGKYKFGEKNGKGNEYSLCENKSLIFEGEYLNGKRNGKGEEYNKNGEFIFEGE